MQYLTDAWRRLEAEEAARGAGVPGVLRGGLEDLLEAEVADLNTAPVAALRRWYAAAAYRSGRGDAFKAHAEAWRARLEEALDLTEEPPAGVHTLAAILASQLGEGAIPL